MSFASRSWAQNADRRRQRQQQTQKVEIGGPADPNFAEGRNHECSGLDHHRGTTAARRGDAEQSAPANLAMTIYPPTELDKIAKAGDPTAQFVQRIGLQSVPR